jgi:hypothetical protein
LVWCRLLLQPLLRLLQDPLQLPAHLMHLAGLGLRVPLLR